MWAPITWDSFHHEFSEGEISNEGQIAACTQDGQEFEGGGWLGSFWVLSAQALENPFRVFLKLDTRGGRMEIGLQDSNLWGPCNSWYMWCNAPQQIKDEWPSRYYPTVAEPVLVEMRVDRILGELSFFLNGEHGYTYSDENLAWSSLFVYSLMALSGQSVTVLQE